MTVLARTDTGIAALHVLVVDDDPSACASYDAALRAQGYEVTTAASRAAALGVVEELEGSIGVLVVDVGLMDTDCTVLAREIVDRIGPRPTLYVTGWTDEFLNLSDAPGRWLVMQMPIEIPRFVAAIDWLVGRRADRPGA